MSDDLLKDDEIIDVRLPRKEYELMRKMIKERSAMNQLTSILKSSWVWVVASGLLALWALWDKIFKVSV